jgi:hypothetical protein
MVAAGRSPAARQLDHRCFGGPLEPLLVRQEILQFPYRQLGEVDIHLLCPYFELCVCNAKRLYRE